MREQGEWEEERERERQREREAVAREERERAAAIRAERYLSLFEQLIDFFLINLVHPLLHSNSVFLYFCISQVYWSVTQGLQEVRVSRRKSLLY